VSENPPRADEPTELALRMVREFERSYQCEHTTELFCATCIALMLDDFAEMRRNGSEYPVPGPRRKQPAAPRKIRLEIPTRISWDA
jgi:hypothetical protein